MSSNESYEGDLINGIRNGKGKLYYEDGSIKYEGEFKNNKFEGNGKFYYRDGNYYIGQFRNGLKHGKGIEYYENGNKIFEGDFINDKKEGNGKVLMKMDIIILGNGKMIHFMVKVHYMIQMEILDMKVNLLMVN